LSEKSIETLVDDIYGLFSGHECDPANVDQFAASLSRIVSERLAEHRGDGPRTLRMSNLGKPDRQLWYDINDPGDAEELSPSTRIKFLFGDILEALLLFLAREAGHQVTHEQQEVELDGIVGHTDAVIDDVAVDVKSASTYAFGKFKSGTLRENDPFGYMEQLASYATSLGGREGAFLAIDKTLGNLTLMRVPAEELQALDIRGRIEHIKEVIASDRMPDRCYPEEEHGKSGNMKLGVNCSYCPHKFKCWADANDGEGLRSFIYANGPVYLTKVTNEPKVFENFPRK